MTMNKASGKGKPMNSKVKKKISHVVIYIARLVFLISISYIVLYPLLYMIISSLSVESAFMSSRRIWLPDSLTFTYYPMIVEIIDYFKTLLSTVKYEIVAALIEVCSCAVAAYGFSRFNFKLKKFCTAMLFLTILIPTAMIIIPLAINYAHLDIFGILGLVNKLTGVDLRPSISNTPWSFWLPSLFAMGLRSGIMIYIYMQFFKGLPGEFEEAAYVDGAGPLRTFLQIIIPSSTVVILTVSVFSIIWHWNDYQMSTMFMNKDLPLSVSLVNLPDQLGIFGYHLSDFDPRAISLLMAACILYILPVLVFYLIIQHWFIESVDRVGITG